jgi:hypothetical protein
MSGPPDPPEHVPGAAGQMEFGSTQHDGAREPTSDITYARSIVRGEGGPVAGGLPACDSAADALAGVGLHACDARGGGPSGQRF